ncbi:replication-relaxation family protein [Streptomyces nigra]|uniref:replication-relaxation family protein n=1 Tax=Streptomyces nigra TaxID=1827580 RepID=UPI0036373721
MRRPPGLGKLRGRRTEVALPVVGTFTAPGRGSLRADTVLTAPEDGVPVLFVEVDNHTEPPAAVADKIARYRKFFQRSAKDHLGRDVPLWSTLWEDSGRGGFPPVALVFTGRPARHAGTHRGSRPPVTGTLAGPLAHRLHQPRKASATATATTTAPCPCSPPPWPCSPTRDRAGRCDGATATVRSRPWSRPSTTPTTTAPTAGATTSAAPPVRQPMKPAKPSGKRSAAPGMPRSGRARPAATTMSTPTPRPVWCPAAANAECAVTAAHASHRRKRSRRRPRLRHCVRVGVRARSGGFASEKARE